MSLGRDEMNMQRVNLRFEKEEDYRTKEAFKTLRTNIEFSGSDIKVIAVTSCTPNEGKSSVTMELAKAFAEAGKVTLLVDADMRKSVLVGRYKTGAVRMGLTHALIGKESYKDVVCSTNVKICILHLQGRCLLIPASFWAGKNFRISLEGQDWILTT